MKKLFMILILLFSSSSFADWSLLAGSGSYMGERHLGITYTSENQKHSTDVSYGQTAGVISEDVEQLNLKYVYSPFSYSYKKVESNILGVGTLISNWRSSKAFVESPSQYPTSDYYSQTKFRLGLVLSSEIKYDKLSFYVDWVLLDQVAIALFNNTKYTSDPNTWAGGFGLRWRI
ncbi:MAG: hypothetical protein ACLGGX_02710 [Bdellovibrionia bacterium]